jgi:hypothetical protein
MSSIPKGIFIQQSDEGTEVFFLTQVGISASPSKAEAEWHVDERTHIPSERILDLSKVVHQVTRIEPPVDFDPETVWFVQHEEYTS